MMVDFEVCFGLEKEILNERIYACNIGRIGVKLFFGILSFLSGKSE
jgi:hypothetical protein